MTTLSPLTADERQLLAAQARGVGWEMARGFAFGGLFLTSILFLILFTTWKFLGPAIGFSGAKHHAGEVLALAMAITALCLLGAARSAVRFARQQAPQARLAQEDLAAGQARVETLTVTAADELPDDYDDGMAFFLQLADNRVLYLNDPSLYCNLEPKTFPARTVHYRTAPRSGLRLGLEPTGDYITPVLLASRRLGRDDIMPEDGTFYDGTLAETRQKFRLVPAKPAS